MICIAHANFITTCMIVMRVLITTIAECFTNLKRFFFNILQVQIGLPITGKYRDPESDQYYNNNNVFIINFVY